MKEYKITHVVFTDYKTVEFYGTPCRQKYTFKKDALLKSMVRIPFYTMDMSQFFERIDYNYVINHGLCGCAMNILECNKEKDVFVNIEYKEFETYVNIMPCDTVNNKTR